MKLQIISLQIKWCRFQKLWWCREIPKSTFLLPQTCLSSRWCEIEQIFFLMATLRFLWTQPCTNTVIHNQQVPQTLTVPQISRLDSFVLKVKWKNENVLLLLPTTNVTSNHDFRIIAILQFLISFRYGKHYFPCLNALSLVFKVVPI